MQPEDQAIRYAELDGRSIAWSAVGSGPPLVVGGWWASHLELDWRNARFRKFVGQLARHRTVIRYDRPGEGLSDRAALPARSLDEELATLETLVDEASPGSSAIELFGASSGGGVASLFAARHPQRLQRLLAISGAHRAHPWASACRALQRRAVALGALQCDERDGLALARQLAILGYRTPEEFDARFGAAQVVAGRVRTAAEDYLDHCAAKYVARTSSTAFVRLSESIDLQALAPESIRVPVTVVAVAEDRLVPVEDAYALVERLAAGGSPQRPQLRVLRSAYGHDAFLKETAAIAGVLREAVQA